MEQLTVKLHNGVSMPQLGLGVWKAKDGEETSQAVEAAIATGYRSIDTASLYGNEGGVGQGIKQSGVAREDLFVTSKLWNSDQGYDKTLAAFDASMERLELDYLDLYLIHWPAPKLGLAAESWRALEKLYADGRVKAIGVCNFQPEHLKELAVTAKIVPMINQIELNPYFQQQETRDYCTEHGIQVESWSPIGGSGGGGNDIRLLDQPVLASIGATHHKSPAQVVIRWHLQNGLVVIPKSVHAERIEQNFDVFDFMLGEEEMHQINALETGERSGPDPQEMNNH